MTGRVLYQLHSLGAAGAPATNPDPASSVPCGRGLRVLHGWLDEIASLGCGGVLLTPIFVSSTHGYDTVDALRIDQRLGDDDDFSALAEGCRERELRLILDGVFNHVGRGFGPFVDVLHRGQASPFAEWFDLDFERDDGDGFGYRTFEGHRELVALNHRNGAVLDWAVEVANTWLDRGADGWRLDAAYAIPPVWIASLVARVRRRHPDAFLFGEVIHGDYAKFVETSTLDSVTQYELYKAIWSSLNDANFWELAWALGRHREFVARLAPVTFAGNHDVTRLATQLTDPGHVAIAVILLLTLPGIPCIYYGDERAWRGTKEQRPGGDDAIRPPLPPVDATLSRDEEQVRDLHRRLVAIRRARPWLTQGDVDVVDVSNRRLIYTVTAGEGALCVVVDVDASALSVAPGWELVAAEPGWAIGERR